MRGRRGWGGGRAGARMGVVGAAGACVAWGGEGSERVGSWQHLRVYM